eukprot:TRINITY_DN1153_c0_g1_i8.p1 TRINITY_DN1153_c0_g1~~TRINITY_DN1153_c0_g1_i8.p1  ORF type:complete len:810 (-),score=82.86 TRINITY_DN1153_c0_g1_i8:36-2465(-)
MERRLQATEIAVANLTWQMGEVMARLEALSKQGATTNFANTQLQSKQEVKRMAGAATESGFDIDSDTDEDSESDESTETSQFTHAEYAIEESIWSSVLFIGATPRLGSGGGTVLFVLFFIQISILFVLANVVASNFTENEYANWTDDFHHWRTNFAHSDVYYDSISNKSLATRVCEDSKAMAFSSFHGEFIHDLNEYKYKSKYFGGPTMCCTAVILWLVSIIRELVLTVEALTVWSSLPRSKRTEVFHHEDQSWSLNSVSFLKLAMVWCVCGIRAVVACCLGYWGSLWLVYTITLPELLLNAVALQFVLDLDEYLFAALAPWSIKKLVSSMRPLRAPKLMYKGIDCRTICSLLLVLLFSALVVVYFLVPFQTNLHELELATCGGTRSFIFRKVPPGVPVTYETFEDETVLNPTGHALPSAGDYDASEENNLTGWLLEQIILNGTNLPKLTLSASEYSTTRFSFSDWSTATVEKASRYYNPFCQDQLNYDAWSWFWARQIQQTYNSSGTSCMDIKWACSLDTTLGQTTRMMCPHSCRCRDRRFVLSKPEFGCPSSCAARQKAWLPTVQIGNRPCRDIPSATNSLWAEYLDSISKVSGKWKLQPIWQEITDVIMACGLCSSRSTLLEYGVDPCSDGDDWPFTSIAAICPVTCGCPSSRVCPISCVGEAASGIEQTNFEQWQTIQEARIMGAGDPLNVTAYYELNGTSLNQCMKKAFRTHVGKCGSICAEGSRLVPENISYISKYGTTYFCSDAERFLRDSALSWECQKWPWLGKNCCVAASCSSRIDVATLPAVLFLVWVRIAASNQAWWW